MFSVIFEPLLTHSDVSPAQGLINIGKILREENIL